MKFSQTLKDENTRFEGVRKELEEKMKDAQNKHRKVQRDIKTAMMKKINRFAKDHCIGETLALHGSEYWKEGKSFIGRYFTTNGKPTELYLMSVLNIINPYTKPVPDYRSNVVSGICFEAKDSFSLEMLTQELKSGRISVNKWNGDITIKDENMSEKKVEDITDALFSFTLLEHLTQSEMFSYQYTDSKHRGIFSGVPIEELGLSLDEYFNIVHTLQRWRN
jgi:hypothetical protein